MQTHRKSHIRSTTNNNISKVLWHNKRKNRKKIKSARLRLRGLPREDKMEGVSPKDS